MKKISCPKNTLSLVTYLQRCKTYFYLQFEWLFNTKSMITIKKQDLNIFSILFEMHFGVFSSLEFTSINFHPMSYKL
jgi:hypothetical protein